MAAIAYRAGGSALQTATTTLGLVAPTVLPDDILFAVIVSINNTAVTAPQGWVLIRDTANTAAMQTYLGWKRAGADDSGATFNFTVAGTTTSFGIIVAYSGATNKGNPIRQSTISNNAAADNVTYATLTPEGLDHIVAFGTYAEDLTTSGTFSGTNPTFTERIDVENATNEDASIFIWDGPVLTIAATGSRTLDTTSTVDAVNQGILVELITQPVPNAGRLGDAVVNYPRNTRIR